MAFLILPGFIGSLLGRQLPLVLQVLGVGLFLFAGDLIWQATRPRILTWRALLTCVQDALWVIGSAILLIFFASDFSTTGRTLIASIAAMVFFFGMAQYIGILLAHRGHSARMYRHCIPIQVNTPAEKLWNAVGDIGNISRYYPFLKHSKLRENGEPRPGMVRECSDQKGRQWAEEFTAYRPGKGYELRFITDDPLLPKFPFPASEMTGGWDLQPIEDGEENNREATLVTVHWELRPQPAFLAGIIVPLLAFQVDRTFPPGVEQMAIDVNGNEPVKSQPQPFLKLLPRIC